MGENGSEIMKSTPKVETRMRGFVEKVQEETRKHYTEKYAILPIPVISVKTGSKFYAVWSYNGTQNSIYCFVDKSNGDIYKAATWRAPAKHVRGSIFDKNFSWDKGVTLYGGAYLK